MDLHINRATIQTFKILVANLGIILAGGIFAIACVSATFSFLGGTMDGVHLPVFDAIVLGILAGVATPSLFFASFLVGAGNRSVNPYMLAVSSAVFTLLDKSIAASIDHYALSLLAPNFVTESYFVRPSTIVMFGVGVIFSAIVFRKRKGGSHHQLNDPALPT